MPDPEYTRTRRHFGPGASPYQVVVDGRKLCSKCERWLVLEAFNIARNRSTGHSAECKKCRRAMPSQTGEERRRVSRDWYRRNGMDRLRVKLYGVTPEQYAALLEKQQRACAICGCAETMKRRDGQQRPLAVDHCHDSGTVRGLLCAACNVAIGLLKHNTDLLDKARAYLEDTQ